MNEYEKEHIEMLHPGWAECTVLLKTDGSFPLGKPCRIAAYGGGIRHTIKGGTGSGEVNSRFHVSVEQGLQDAGFEITTTAWLEAYEDVLVKAHEQFVKDVKASARKHHTLAMLEALGAIMAQPEYELPLDAPAEDPCIYVLTRISGEGTDRTATPGDLLLSETEKRDILALNEKHEKFMLVLNVGGPVDLTPVMDVKNILVLSQLGVGTGTALADIILGTATPSGKLATTWATADNYPSVGTFGERDTTSYKEGIYVGYRWTEAADKPALYPFGYGLSYTTFSLGDSRITMDGTKVSVTTAITNTGSYTGKEVLEIYVSCPEGKLDKPVKDLAGFKKTRALEPGETELATAAFDMRLLASYDARAAAYVLEKGTYVVLAGTDSASVFPVAKLSLERDIIVRKVKNLLGNPGFADWSADTSAKRSALLKAAEDAYVPELKVDPSSFITETADYDIRNEISEDIQKLSVDELAHLTMGYFDPHGGIAAAVGISAATVAGAAGETHKVANYPSMVLSDGPAGIRLSEKYFVDKKGAHAYQMALPESILEFTPGIVKMFFKPPKLPKGTEMQEQYCTAIPIGTALAQSWNPDYARLCGDMVGLEMEIFHIDFWLAPALNIHRTPYCGRNYEYYSEDPLISGIMAAAVTEGVQAHPGRGVTIKHFAANNQETNRYFNSSNVSERAMREIYLKGFAICIQKASPKAIMSSYNLLNGKHTSENMDLCTDILRGEWNYTGLCMTDWVIKGLKPEKGSLYDFPDPALVLTTTDIYMPGSKVDYKKVLKGLKAGRVSMLQLQTAAQRVATTALALKAAQAEQQK
ncbi:MAG: glycoside hydrolase family 3 C-terminal domain-containing protein [Clostridia bacterium]|nr:glycoside hydrolase family 3 C-terminal domain-containing protein [Clostridia bacterium]